MTRILWSLAFVSLLVVAGVALAQTPSGSSSAPSASVSQSATTPTSSDAPQAATAPSSSDPSQASTTPSTSDPSSSSSSSTKMPKTASPMPLVGLTGLALLAAAHGVTAARRRLGQV